MTITDLSIGYKKPILKGISFELMPGRFVCLIGRNGTGKSTLLKTLAGLLPPLEGQIWLDDRQLSQYTPTEVARRVALVLTSTPDLANTTLRQLVAYGRLPYSSWLGKLHDADWQAADQAIARMSITHLAPRRLSELSDGERQKAMIARALAQGTDHLLLDEPSAFLDYESRQELMSLLLHLAHDEGKAILLSTHDLELARKHADQILDLNAFSASAKADK